tara:strand:- start:1770 stop:2048 length:279 start_codon:yes stop_codon:yes gene_type:complete
VEDTVDATGDDEDEEEDDEDEEDEEDEEHEDDDEEDDEDEDDVDKRESHSVEGDSKGKSLKGEVFEIILLGPFPFSMLDGDPLFNSSAFSYT